VLALRSPRSSSTPARSPSTARTTNTNHGKVQALTGASLRELDTFTNAGTLALGPSDRFIQGSYTQSAVGTVALAVSNGTTPTMANLSAATVTLAGTLKITETSGHPAVGTALDAIDSTFTPLAGKFAKISPNPGYLIQYSPQRVTLLADERPTAAFTVTTTTPKAGSPVSFDASHSTDPDGTLTYSWNFGDGSATASGVAPSHTYSTPGTYTVTLTVTDSGGPTATTTHKVTVT
jgi:PKD repeat protein